MAKKTPNLPTGGNSGVQARNVNADVLAVGDNAKATKTITGPAGAKEAERSLEDLKSIVKALKLSPAIRGSLDGKINMLAAAARDPKRDHNHAHGILSTIASQLKDAGHVVTRASTLGQALHHVATLLGVAWSAFS